MLRMLFWTAATATAVLGLLWAAHHFVPAVSGLGDLNDVMGITAGVCAVITLVLFFVPRRGARGEESRTGGTTNRIEGEVQGAAVQAETIQGDVQVRSYGGDHVDFSGATFHDPLTGKRGTGPDRRDGGKQ